VIWYLSHPQVVIDPAVPVPEWGLSDKGRERVTELALTGWPQDAVTILTSPEVKARETAALLAAPRGLEVTVVPKSGEVDRSSTGYVPHDQHEALADALFAHPDISACGWETAKAAQHRVVTALSPFLVPDAGPTVIIGHGGVGTLLWCHIANLAISRAEDQPGVGHVWCANWATGGLVPLHPWRSLESVARGSGLDVAAHA
jgi:broad specificity phosphatase PhoE